MDSGKYMYAFHELRISFVLSSQFLHFHFQCQLHLLTFEKHECMGGKGWGLNFARCCQSNGKAQTDKDHDIACVG